jgi:uncharacterized protein YhdP
VLLWIATAGLLRLRPAGAGLRYAVLPQIETTGRTSSACSAAAINRPVGIRKIEAHWAGLRPALRLDGFEIRDAQGRPALAFDEVEPNWPGVPCGISSCAWHAWNSMRRRCSCGATVRAASLPPAWKSPRNRAATPAFADWLLVQGRVVIRDASIAWTDELRGAPPLELKRVNFQLDNSGNRHRFGLTAEPPRELAARIDIRGDFKGRDIDELDSWKGEAYAELDYADLAVWRTWIDYPVALPQGNGALRLWLGFAGKQPVSATADVRLADVRLQLRPDLPELDLVLLEGRLPGAAWTMASKPN